MGNYYNNGSWPFCDGNICDGQADCQYGDRGCDAVWKRYQLALAYSFQQANPLLDLSRFIEVHIGSKTATYGVDGASIQIWQPYTGDYVGREATYRDKLAGMGLSILRATPGRSWYFPGRTELLLLGPSHLLANCSLNYDLPDPGLRPIRYVRWQHDYR